MPDRRFLQALALGVLGAVGALIALWSVLGWLLAQIAWTEIWLIGGGIRWLGTFAGDLGWFSFLAGAGGLTWFLFPAAAVAMIGLFQDRICRAVELKHYPELPLARDQPVAEAVVQAVRFLAVTILINMLVLPFYLLFLVFFGTGALLYLAVNGYLVGRELIEMAASRRMMPEEVRRLRRGHRVKIIVFGALAVFLMSVPLLNLVAPVISIAAAVHVFQRINRA